MNRNICVSKVVQESFGGLRVCQKISLNLEEFGNLVKKAEKTLQAAKLDYP